MTIGLLMALISGSLTYDAFVVASAPMILWIMIVVTALLATLNIAMAISRLKAKASNR